MKPRVRTIKTLPPDGPLALQSIALFLLFPLIKVDWTIKAMTGLNETIFDRLLQHLTTSASKKIVEFRKHVLPVKWRLIIFLFKLRHAPKVKIAASLFSTSPATISRTCRTMMPIVYERYDFFHVDCILRI